MANRVPDGFEEEEGPLNVELRPEEATLQDYEDVPIEVKAPKLVTRLLIQS